MGSRRIKVRERRYKNGSRVGVICLEDGERGTQAEEYSRPLEARKGRETSSPLESPEGKQACQHLDFSPV